MNRNTHLVGWVAAFYFLVVNSSLQISEVNDVHLAWFESDIHKKFTEKLHGKDCLKSGNPIWNCSGCRDTNRGISTTESITDSFNSKDDVYSCTSFDLSISISPSDRSCTADVDESCASDSICLSHELRSTETRLRALKQLLSEMHQKQLHTAIDVSNYIEPRITRALQWCCGLLLLLVTAVWLAVDRDDCIHYSRIFACEISLQEHAKDSLAVFNECSVESEQSYQEPKAKVDQIMCSDSEDDSNAAAGRSARTVCVRYSPRLLRRLHHSAAATDSDSITPSKSVARQLFSTTCCIGDQQMNESSASIAAPKCNIEWLDYDTDSADAAVDSESLIAQKENIRCFNQPRSVFNCDGSVKGDDGGIQSKRVLTNRKNGKRSFASFASRDADTTSARRRFPSGSEEGSGREGAAQLHALRLKVAALQEELASRERQIKELEDAKSTSLQQMMEELQQLRAAEEKKLLELQLAKREAEDAVFMDSIRSFGASWMSELSELLDEEDRV